MSRETVAWVTSKPCALERVDDLALAADRPRHDEVADGALALQLEVVAVAAGPVAPVAPVPCAAMVMPPPRGRPGSR